MSSVLLIDADGELWYTRQDELGVECISMPYTYNDTVRRIELQLRERLSMPEYRRKRLRQLIGLTPTVKVMEAHSGITGLIVEKTVVEDDKGGLALHCAVT